MAVCLFNSQPSNLITDSQYVANLFLHLTLDLNLLNFPPTLQTLFTKPHHPLYMAHIHSHSPLPSILSEGNQCADHALLVAALFTDLLQSHEFFFNLQNLFINSYTYPSEEACPINSNCTQCAQTTHYFPFTAANPH